MLTAKLILDRLDKDYRLLERREQASRSFTKGFIELLYLQHTQLAADVYNVPNIDSEPVPLEGVGASVAINRGYSPRLIIGAPPGLSSLNHSYYSQWNHAFLLGVDVGIGVGVGTTAVTPTDRRLEQRIGHGRRSPDGAAVLFESYTTGEDGERVCYSPNWAAQPFMPTVSHRCTSVRVKIFKTGAPGDLTVELRPMDALDYVPGTAILATGTIAEGSIPGASPGDWVECTFVAPADLYAGHRYFIVMYHTGDAGNKIEWRFDATGATYKRAYLPTGTSVFCYYHWSTDSGVTWSSINGGCFMFEEKGQSVGEFEVGGCELLNINFSDPNGEFTIRRYFTNECGESITVNEVGIVSVGEDLSEFRAWPILIAHDIVAPGVAVADGELLRVTYVPQITV